MKAAPSRQMALLDVQAIDTRVAQCDHRRASLPQRAELQALTPRLEAAESAVVLKQTAHDDIKQQVRKAEADVLVVRDRMARDQKRLDAGIGSAKDLQGLQHEMTSLARRQAALEDEELEIMERAEDAEKEAAAATAELAALTDHAASLTAQIIELEAEIDADRRATMAPRADIAAQVGDDLLALYDKIRARSGTGAAALVARACGGCQLELNAVEVSRFRSADEDEVLRCEECSRILVRTQESGL
ncbi:MAG: C4-type zinc ribbon domain-containing protein [Ornithinimicrobium sp.]